MNTFVRNTLLVAVLAVGANSLTAAPAKSGEPTVKQFTRETKALELTAATPEQHKVLAAEYRQLAQLQLAESRKHAEMATWYAKFPNYTSTKFRASTIDHCNYFAGKYQDEADRSEKKAARHEALAG